jgi:hypothetical protein
MVVLIQSIKETISVGEYFALIRDVSVGDHLYLPRAIDCKIEIDKECVGDDLGSWDGTLTGIGDALRGFEGDRLLKGCGGCAGSRSLMNS